MIKKFNEYIKEGLWLKGIKRSKVNKQRLENVIRDKKELKRIIKERIKNNPDANLNDIDVSQMTDMRSLFKDSNIRNIDISNWDVSNVKNMVNMFSGCYYFNCDLSKWDVSNVENMNGMFHECEKFNSDLSNWDVSNVKNMAGMLFGCKNFNQNLDKWDVSNVKKSNFIINLSGLEDDPPIWYKDLIYKTEINVSEGLWSKGIERSKTSEMRKGDLDMFNDMYKILHNWFCDSRNQIYQAPNKKPLAQFSDFNIIGDGTYEYIQLEFLNNCSEDKKKIIKSDEFKEKLSTYFIPF